MAALPLAAVRGGTGGYRCPCPAPVSPARRGSPGSRRPWPLSGFPCLGTGLRAAPGEDRGGRAGRPLGERPLGGRRRSGVPGVRSSPPCCLASLLIGSAPRGSERSGGDFVAICDLIRGSLVSVSSVLSAFAIEPFSL